MTTSTLIELNPPDIEPWRQGNTGIEFVHTFNSAHAGPHVMINCITHGNEICGAIVVDRMLRMGVRPDRGSLTLSFANIDAYARWNPADPHANRFVDEDFNRVWSEKVLDIVTGDSHDSVELRRARALRPAVERADFLLDIHSMHNPHGAVMICGPLDKGIAFARQVGIPAYIVSDIGHANGTRMRDYGGFGNPDSDKNALLVECGQHWEKAAAEVAWQTTWRFLKVLGLVDETQSSAQLQSTPLPVQQVIRVTEAVVANSADFVFAEGLGGLSVLKKGDLFATDNGKPLYAPYDHCVLIMPTLIHVKPGLTAVRLGKLE